MLRLKTFGGLSPESEHGSLVFTSDVAEFEDAVARDDAARAAIIYTRAFLDGVFLPDAPDFDHWIDGIRLRLGQTDRELVLAVVAPA